MINIKTLLGARGYWFILVECNAKVFYKTIFGVFYKFTSADGYLQYFRKDCKTFNCEEKIQSNFFENNKIKLFNMVNNNKYVKIILNVTEGREKCPTI